MTTDTTLTRAGGLLSPLLPSSHTLVMGHNAEAVLGQIASAERLLASAAALAVMQWYSIVLRKMRSWTARWPSAEFFLYDSSDRRFYTYEPLANFVNSRTDLESLMCIRIVAEKFHDLFLLRLINGLHFIIPRIEPGIMIGDLYGTMDKVRSSLATADGALETARRTADIAEAVKAMDPVEHLHEAETPAEQAYEKLKKSFSGGYVEV